MQAMDRTTLGALVVGALMVLAGLGWIGQGLGIITGGSFMVGDRTWAVIGAGFVVVGALIAQRAWSRRTR